MSDQFDVEAMVMSGAPVEFELVEIVKDEDGNEVEKSHKFGLRQMTPRERDRLSYIETKERDRVLAEYRADGLGELPMSDDMQEAKRSYDAMLEQTYQGAVKLMNDETSDDTVKRAAQEAAKQAAIDMEDTSIWPRSLAHERASDAVDVFEWRWVVENLLEGDRDKFVKLTIPDPRIYPNVVTAMKRWRQVTQYVPNSNGRRR